MDHLQHAAQQSCKHGWDIKMFDYILEMMMNGHWAEAQKEFKAINPTGREYQNWLEEQSTEDLADLALLGFYCREFKPDKREY